MLLNVASLGATSNIGLAIDRSWIVKGQGSNRPASIEGVDHTLTEFDSKFQALKNQYYACRMLPSRMVNGAMLYFRIYFFTSTQIAVWGTANAFSAWFPAGWHTVKCEYFANGQNRYTIDGTVRYSGTVRGIPDFYWTGAGIMLVDIGNRGGALPAGFEWW